jgi:hypothetical protein
LRLVEHRGAHSYGSAILNDTPVQDRIVANRHMRRYEARTTRICVKHGAVLDIGSLTDPNRFVIPTKHSIVPDAGILLDLHVPNQKCTFRQKRGGIDLGVKTIESLEMHLSPSRE